MSDNENKDAPEGENRSAGTPAEEQPEAVAETGGESAASAADEAGAQERAAEESVVPGRRRRSVHRLAQRQRPGGKNAPEAASRTAAGETGPALPTLLPVVPLRDVVLFNFMILPLFISRERSMAAIETTVEGPHYVLALTQKNDSTDEPGADDLYDVGIIVQVLRILKMPDNHMKALVQGVARARVLDIDTTGPYMTARVETIPDLDVPRTSHVEAMLRVAREQSEMVLSLRGVAAPELTKILQEVDSPGRLADLVAANLRLRTSEAQQLLEINDPVERLRRVTIHLEHEVEVANMQMRIHNSAREGMDKAQKDFYLREQLKAIRHELGDKEESADEEMENLKKALEKAGMPAEVKKEADKQYRRLSLMHSDSPEAAVLRNYLELMSELPWKKVSRDNLDIRNARTILDEDHYGLDKIKDRILEFLSVHKLNPKTHGSILCFVGPPGVGKTSLGKSIARALGRKFERLSLGGMHDEAEIRGHRRTYIGAMPGRILQALRHAGTRNPVIVLDEMDKVGNDFRGDPQSALLEVLDPEQNSTFSDHYLNVPFDLSKVMFLCTANQLDTIPPALRDRMEIIRLPGYTMQEKACIAVRYLVKKRVEDNGLSMDEVTFTDEAINTLIRSYTREAGVRELERQIGAVCRKLARKKAEGAEPPFRVDAADLQGLLGPAVFLDDEHQDKLMPGMAYGLAWTSAGGEVLTIEAAVFKGKGKVQLTGSLGDVMKESAQAAISYIRSRAAEFGIDEEFDSKNDIHVHVPDGATPKDGPSAGVTLTTALFSALTGTPAAADLCMTGEIDLKGRVLPVGGIKEKLLGAMAFNLRRACIPWQNQKDLEDIPEDLRDRLKILPVRTYDEILKAAFPGRRARRRRAAKQPAEAAAPAGTQGQQ